MPVMQLVADLDGCRSITGILYRLDASQKGTPDFIDMDGPYLRGFYEETNILGVNRKRTDECPIGKWR